MKKAGIASIETLILKRQLRWVGHVIRMPATRLPRMLLYGQLSEGRRNVGGQRRRYKDLQHANLKKTGVRSPSLETSAADRVGWRTACHNAVTSLEASRTARRLQRRAQRHAALLLPPPTLDTEYDCSFCGKMLRSRIGLVSHLRVHQRQLRSDVDDVVPGSGGLP